MDKKHYKVETWGCQMNVHESEKIAGIAQSLGYVPTDDEKEADLIILNTCCVREHAEAKVYGRLGRLKSLKRKNPDLIIGIGGCMTQQKDEAQHIAKRYPYVDFIFGTHNLHKLSEMIANAKGAGSTIVDIQEDGYGKIVEGLPVERDDRVKAWVSIMQGCNNFCTYCIVPYVRGRERSRSREEIIKEVRGLAVQGYKEVTLLGQNVNSYGKDLEKPVDFSALLRELNEVEGIERLRFTTSHPKDLSEDLIFAVKDCEKVCEHIHLPFQAGSTEILRRMNRKYTKEQYLALAGRIKKEIPGVSITTDIMVGFPGETEDDFEDTLDVVRKVRFDAAFTFLYSPRRGTPAAKMKDQVPYGIKHPRFLRLLDLTQKISAEENAKMKGKTVELLVEGVSKNDPARLTGRTRTNKLVHFTGDANLIGKLINVKVTEPRNWSLYGEIVRN